MPASFQLLSAPSLRFLATTRNLGLAAALATLPLVALAHGDLHDREPVLQAQLVGNPNNASLQFELAWLYCQHGEWQSALSAAAHTEALAPGVHPVDLVRGRAANGLRRYTEARTALDRFLAAHPDRHDARVDRARALAGLGETVASLADYRAALAAAARPPPDIVIEAVEAMVTAGLPAEAAAVLAMATDKSGPHPQLALKALELDIALRRFDAALHQAEVLRTLAPRPEPWMARRAELLTQAGREAEARAAWHALLAHLAALPNLDRGSPPMQQLAAQARSALAAPSPPSSP